MKRNFKIIFLSFALCFTICTTLLASLTEKPIENPTHMPIDCTICNTEDGNIWFWETDGTTTTITCVNCGVSHTYPAGIIV